MVRDKPNRLVCLFLNKITDHWVTNIVFDTKYLQNMWYLCIYRVLSPSPYTNNTWHRCCEIKNVKNVKLVGTQVITNRDWSFRLDLMGTSGFCFRLYSRAMFHGSIVNKPMRLTYECVAKIRLEAGNGRLFSPLAPPAGAFQAHLTVESIENAPDVVPLSEFALEIYTDRYELDLNALQRKRIRTNLIILYA